jgi:hypothetical protein
MKRNVDTLEEAAESDQAKIDDISPDSDADEDLDDRAERELRRLNIALRRTR